MTMVFQGIKNSLNHTSEYILNPKEYIKNEYNKDLR